MAAKKVTRKDFLKLGATGSRGLAVSLIAFAAALSLPAVASAHHSTNMFDSDNPIELAGTVVEWQFKNPHCFVMLEVTDEDGETEVWALEGLSPNVIYRMGWRPDTLQPGDEIVATVFLLHSGAPGGSYRELRWADGTPIDPNAPRPD